MNRLILKGKIYLIKVNPTSSHQTEEDNSTTPNVNVFPVVALIFDDLRRDVVERATGCVEHSRVLMLIFD